MIGTPYISPPPAGDCGSDTVGSSGNAGFAVVNHLHGQLTSEVLNLAPGAEYTVTLLNNTIGGSSIVVASVSRSTFANGSPIVSQVFCTNGTCFIIITNRHLTDSVTGTVKINFIQPS